MEAIRKFALIGALLFLVALLGINAAITKDRVSPPEGEEHIQAMERCYEMGLALAGNFLCADPVTRAVYWPLPLPLRPKP